MRRHHSFSVALAPKQFDLGCGWDHSPFGSQAQNAPKHLERPIDTRQLQAFALSLSGEVGPVLAGNLVEF